MPYVDEDKEFQRIGLTLFLKIKWNKRGFNSLLKKRFGQTESTDTKHEGGRPKIVSTEENVTTDRY